ncbi:MAG: GLPGLI family protein [Muribaculaceae bacterium]|nr:GLPGLI family protein [Muribaculaceae bacterium]
MKKPEWEIADETRDILGYQCFKATTDYRGRQWTAWFTPKIPMQDGPWKFCGLPVLF